MHRETANGHEVHAAGSSSPIVTDGKKGNAPAPPFVTSE